MAKKISISFKETKKDQELWEVINMMDDKSYELKEILRKALLGDKKEVPVVKEVKEENNNVNILDF